MQVSGSLEHQAKSEEGGERGQDRPMEKVWEGETHSLIPQLSTEHLLHVGASLVAQTVENLPATQENWVRSLGREDPLEKETVIHSSVVGWRTPWTEEPGGLQSMRLQSQT